MWVPTPNVDAAVLPPGDVWITGLTTASCSPPSARRRPGRARGAAPVPAGGVLDALDPLDGRDARRARTIAPTATMPISEPSFGMLLAEEQDQEERDRRDAPG